MVVGYFVGLGEGSRDGESDGDKVVGKSVGAGEGTIDGIELGDGDGIAEGL